MKAIGIALSFILFSTTLCLGLLGNANAMYLYKFLCWICFTIGIINVIGKHSVPYEKRKRSKFLNYTAIAYDVIASLALAYFGHWFYAALQILQLPMEQYYFES